MNMTRRQGSLGRVRDVRVCPKEHRALEVQPLFVNALSLESIVSAKGRRSGKAWRGLAGSSPRASDKSLDTILVEGPKEARFPKRERSSHSWLFALAVLTSTCLFMGIDQVAAADEKKPAKPLGNTAASEKLLQVEIWSKEAASAKGSSLPGAEVQNAVAELQENPKMAVPLFSKAFIDKTKARTFRLNCAQLLRESGYAVPAEDATKLETVVEDSKEDPLIRVFAAYFILKDMNRHPASLEKSIANMASEFFRKGKEKDFVRMLLVPQLAGSPQLEEIMLEELHAGHELNVTINALGKLRAKSAISPIVRLLRSKNAGKTFYKTRGYLALGEIGGPLAFDRLVEFLAVEQSLIERKMILMGIGRTRDPRAKDFLVDYLLRKPNSYYMISLDALRLTGDPAVIPIFEAELAKPLPSYEKNQIERMLEAVKRHDYDPAY